VIFGTRPEAIKLCPLIQALRQQSDWETLVCVTAQHRQILDQVLAAFDVKPDFDLDLMQPNQTLPALTARLIARLEKVFSEAHPSLAVVQGDTTTSLCAALCAFYARVPVAHVEAGLRTFDRDEPFPEEMNRVLLGRLATLHFAATEGAAENLRHDGVAHEQIEVTGNTGIDAVLAIRSALESGRMTNESQFRFHPERKLIVVTAHRRESFGNEFENICHALLELSSRADTQIVWPLHPNPSVQNVARQILHENPNILLTEPLDYVPFVDLMRRAYLLITDSGGIQEEGPSLGKPVLVVRNKTERHEAISAGTAKLIGTDRAAIVREAARLLDDSVEYARMARQHNPYGDGNASARIVRRVTAYLSGSTRRSAE
jgi:UDP-N-acetylglucosamine 2-epimerase (non-hydrolysing)